MNDCVECMGWHKLHNEFVKSPGFLIDQRLNGFFVDREDESGKVRSLIFIFEKAEFTISWDKEKDSFKFSVATR